MKIYVITAGYYSDYHICGVATTLEMAEKLKEYYKNDIWNRDSIDIEIYDSNKYEQAVDFHSRGYRLFQITKYLNGETSAWEREIYSDSIKINEVEFIPQRGIRGKPHYIVWVYAKTEEYAKKIGCDLIAQFQYEHEVEGEH